MKNMYGKSVRGIERSTFIIDEQGLLVHEWRKVQVKEHVSEVLAQLKTL
jgi:peroxiredoxin Q/BCP